MCFWITILTLAVGAAVALFAWWVRRTLNALRQRLFIEGRLDVLEAVMLKEVWGNRDFNLESAMHGLTGLRLARQVERMSDPEIDEFRSSPGYRSAEQATHRAKLMGWGTGDRVEYRPPGQSGDWHCFISQCEDAVAQANAKGRGDLAAWILPLFTRMRGKPLPSTDQEQKAVGMRVSLALINMSEQEVRQLRDAIRIGEATRNSADQVRQ